MFYYPSSLASRRLQFRHAVEEHKNSEMENIWKHVKTRNEKTEVSVLLLDNPKR